MAKADDDFITLARDRWDQAERATRDQRQRDIDALRCYAGDMWTDDQKEARQGQGAKGGLPPIPARPIFVINKLREPVRQVLNQEEQSEFGIELVAADDFGGLAPDNPVVDDEIELREGLARRIQRTSELQDARLWAASRAAIAGLGYYGILTRYLPGKTWDQEVYGYRYLNQASVLLDPAHVEPDGSDADWGFDGVDMPIDKYEAEYGKQNSKGQETNRVVRKSQHDRDWRAFGDEAPGWFGTDVDGKRTRFVRVVNYWYTVRKSRVLCLMPDGTAVWEDELPEDAPAPVDTRPVTLKTIKWAKIDGSQKLEETDWEGHFIPIIKVLGEELHPYDDERRAEGMVGPSIDSNRGFNAMACSLVERIGLMPLPPLLMDDQAIGPYQGWYQLANTRALPYLPFVSRGADGQPNALPTRAPADTNIQPAALALQMFDEAIKSTTGIPDPAMGHQDPNVKSGKMALAMIQQAQHGTSHFLKNLQRSIRYEGQIINDLLYPIYGRRPGRVATLVTGEGESQTVRIGPPPAMNGLPAPMNGQPQSPQSPQSSPSGPPMPGPIPHNPMPGAPPPAPPKTFALTPDANFNVAVTVTRSSDTRRQEESQIVGELLSAMPVLLTWFGDLFFKNQDGPGHVEMADRAKIMLDPKIQQMLSAKDAGSAIPPQVQQQLTQQKQQLDDAHGLLQKAMSEIQGKQAEFTSREKIAQWEIASKERMAAADRETKITVAEEGAKVDRMQLFLDERARIGVQQQDAQQAQLDRAHDVGMAAMDQQHQVATGAAQAGNAADSQAAQQAHEADQAQQAQQAPQPPPPDAGGGA